MSSSSGSLTKITAPPPVPNVYDWFDEQGLTEGALIEDESDILHFSVYKPEAFQQAQGHPTLFACLSAWNKARLAISRYPVPVPLTRSGRHSTAISPTHAVLQIFHNIQPGSGHATDKERVWIKRKEAIDAWYVSEESRVRLEREIVARRERAAAATEQKRIKRAEPGHESPPHSGEGMYKPGTKVVYAHAVTQPFTASAAAATARSTEKALAAANDAGEEPSPESTDEGDDSAYHPHGSRKKSKSKAAVKSSASKKRKSTSATVVKTEGAKPEPSSSSSSSSGEEAQAEDTESDESAFDEEGNYRGQFDEQAKKKSKSS
jgi:hypothetical protein